MPLFSSAAQRWLLGLAHLSLEAAARGQSFPVPDSPSELDVSDRRELDRPRGAFVTLFADGQLRGCVGRTTPDLPLRRAVAAMTRAAALEDSRFSPVESGEVPRIHVEISVLSPFFPVEPAQIVPGTHGLMIRRGLHQGLLLPQVAAANGWDAETFLRTTCRKAGLPPDAWKNGATVEAFTTEVFED